jgi:hypothetical protein
MNNRKLIFNLVVILNANALAMAATGTWHSIAVGRIVPPAVRISLWSRVKSKRGVQFRKWANKVLKQYLLRGYVVNQRLEQLERRVAATEEKIYFFVHKSLPPVEGVFYDGQIFDAYAQIYREVLH